MVVLRFITLSLLVVFLAASGGMARPLERGCDGAHCDNIAMQLLGAEHIQMTEFGDPGEETDGQVHGKCDQHLCQVAAIMPRNILAQNTGGSLLEDTPPLMLPARAFPQSLYRPPIL